MTSKESNSMAYPSHYVYGASCSLCWKDGFNKGFCPVFFIMVSLILTSMDLTPNISVNNDCYCAVRNIELISFHLSFKQISQQRFHRV